LIWISHGCHDRAFRTAYDRIVDEKCVLLRIICIRIYLFKYPATMLYLKYNIVTKVAKDKEYLMTDNPRAWTGKI